MPDTDVEKTLKEIRERVRVQIRLQMPVSDRQSSEHREVNAAAIESLKANLSVIQRSWNKLPPLTSYRSGWIASLELWCKRILKKASHWFTWEQVNFNSATSNSLQDILIALSAHEELLVELKERLEKIASDAAEMQTNLQALGANGGPGEVNFHDERTLSDKLQPARLTGSLSGSNADQHQLIDSEINSLARRIEELRALKARLD
jgi:hypothetical protein